MSDGDQIKREQLPLSAVAAELRQTLPFSETNLDELQGIGPIERMTVPAGALLTQPGDASVSYCVVVHGEIRSDVPEADGSRTTAGFAREGEGFGETPLLMSKKHSFITYAVKDSLIIKFSESDFWNLLACCPATRKVILGNMMQRLQTHQVEALHKEKLVSLGTLAAGLMHELHNPGSAAKRASSQLRTNLLKLQQLSLRFSEETKTPAQMECMKTLLEHTVRGCQMPAMSTIEQSDAEEEIASWLSSAGVENAYGIAPGLVGIGLKQEQLQCAKDAFNTRTFSDTLNWLEALVSSVTLVCTIEESITRVSDLVMAVKKFAYDDKSPTKQLDVHDSLQSTLTILGHKLRIKGIQVEKDFAASPSMIYTKGMSLSQVWTNLIDNALDASPSNTKIKISTWIEKGETPDPANKAAASEDRSGAGENSPAENRTDAAKEQELQDRLAARDKLAVSIEDHGAGIAPEALPRIFEAFFTTKPMGSGTGLGLEIVHRIVTQKFGGTIQVESVPGMTRFIVRLPMLSAAECGYCVLPAR
jgi:signal transduction histidine kinase